jgi:outer membrane receptor protein involved in Fe transport
MKTIIASMILLCGVAFATPTFAQQTTGTIQGRITDAQKAAVPGVTITAKNKQTGFTRSEVSDAEGRYLLNALPVGNYDVHAQISGFSPFDRKAVVVNVGQTTDVNVELTLAGLAESVSVTAEQPLVQTTSSSVGGVVDVKRIENMPLNGRQFANLAATIPGVGLGFHSDPTKSTQYSPQINGGNGRNLNYQIDGGDNNDDTVGGLLQLFPLEAIQEFNFTTSRAKAEYGRSNGGVMSIVTKSGTNDLHGSFFELFRDKSMNAETQTEINHDTAARDAGLAEPGKGDYRRNQFGGSFGGPIVKDKAHYFVAYERTQQDTTQAVSTQGLFPSFDGVFGTPYRENLLTTKVTSQLNAKQYLAVRYGRNTNSQPYGADSSTAPNGWGDSTNKFNSINLNHNWILGGGKLNEFIFQYADFGNHIGAASTDTRQTFPNGVAVGQSPNTPQTTQQHKFQFRDDFSWHVSGMGGLGHDFKAGANFINEPHLFITFNSGKGVFQYSHLTNDIGGPIATLSVNDGDASANIPLKQYAFYVQDDWHVTDRLTANLGLRYDLIDGYQIDQSKNPNFVTFQTLGAAGAFQGIKGLEDFGLSPKNDTNNWQPRLGLVWDVRGDARDVVRGGFGIYMDMAYTNANVLFPASDATGKGFGTVINIDDPAGIKNPDGSFYQIGQPIANIISQNQADTSTIPLFGQWLDPRLQMPYTRQTSAGWSHQLSSTMVFSADFVRADGRDLNSRPRLNVRPVGQPNAPRVLAFTGLRPNALGTRPAISQATSEYTAGIFALRRRMTHGIDFSATYTLAKAHSVIGTAADELNSNNLQDATLLYDDPRVDGPTSRTDARHQGTLAGVFQLKGGFTVAPIFLFKSPLPVSTIDGRDLNLNSERNDLPARAFQYDGLNSDGTVKVKDIGECKTWNCGRGAWRTLMNLRVSKSFHLAGTSQIEAIGEVFNLFNGKNPSGFVTSQFFTSGAPNPDFMRPLNFSGDFQQPEQRVGQIGFRFSF